MTSARMGSWSHLLQPNHILAEAFSEDDDRIANQLAVATGMSHSDVTSVLREVKASAPSGASVAWQFTLEDIHVFAHLTERTLYVYHGRALQSFVQRHLGTRTCNHMRRSLILSHWAGRVYFYAKGAAYVAAKDAAIKPQLCASVVDQGGGAEQRFLVGLPICTMKTPPAIVLERSARSEPKAVEPQDFPWDIALQDIALVPPGNYHTKSEDGPYDEERGRTLKGLVTLLVNQGRYPRVRYQRYPPKMGSTAPADMPSCIVYTKTAMDCSAESRGEIRVSSHARDATQTAAWARVLDIPYSGQSLGVFTNRALDVILRRRHRKYLSRMNKDAMLEEQCHSCKLCGDALGSDTIFDHIVPLHQLARALSGSMASSQAPSEFQAICGQCSANKTAKEPRASASAGPSVGGLCAKPIAAQHHIQRC
jgi:5-methylcytosine-specific restriction endonuclease McrA